MKGLNEGNHSGLYVGYVPGFPVAHSQGENLDELERNVKEVLEMLLEDGEPASDIGLTEEGFLANRM